jgi:hypothetical protein
MNEMSNEIELALDQLVVKHRKYWSSTPACRQYVYESFANWLVKKFEEETNVK